MNYHDTLIEVADDCPATEAQVPQARGGKKTKAVVEYELLVKHPYVYTEEDIAFEVYAVLHEIPKTSRPKERAKFLSKGHPHVRVSALANATDGESTTTLKARSRWSPLNRPGTSSSWAIRASPGSRCFVPVARE
jgi:hypothetical protein